MDTSYFSMCCHITFSLIFESFFSLGLIHIIWLTSAYCWFSQHFGWISYNFRSWDQRQSNTRYYRRNRRSWGQNSSNGRRNAGLNKLHPAMESLGLAVLQFLRILISVFGKVFKCMQFFFSKFKAMAGFQQTIAVSLEKIWIGSVKVINEFVLWGCCDIIYPGIIEMLKGPTRKFPESWLVTKPLKKLHSQLLIHIQEKTDIIFEMTRYILYTPATNPYFTEEPCLCMNSLYWKYFLDVWKNIKQPWQSAEV